MTQPFDIDHNGGFDTHWYCQPPGRFDHFKVLEEEWNEDFTIRSIKKIELAFQPKHENPHDLTVRELVEELTALPDEMNGYLVYTESDLASGTFGVSWVDHESRRIYL